MYAWIAIGLAFAASLGFGAVQTWNLRVQQRQCAEAIASHIQAIATQNEKVTEWEQKATQAQAKASEAAKLAAAAATIAKAKEATIKAVAPPSAGASCEERENATLDLLRRSRRP
jgi:predicted lysophospholipase L1 biosynthesis ABC-type transport system permease subunit